MSDIKGQSLNLQNRFQALSEQINLERLINDKNQLENKINSKDFWGDKNDAQAISQQHSRLSQKISRWVDIKSDIDDLVELTKINDQSFEEDLKKQLASLEKRVDLLEDDLKFSGPYDDHNVILSIYSGAGGTDAQDWASMLLRMYIRWAEKQNFKVEVLEETNGDEAGIKKATLRVIGENAYGLLKAESGVHRLVRLSPFNADKLRQTSFARVEVIPAIDKPDDIVLDDKELKIDVYRSGGRGGQSVNTTDSAVRITHLPTGISIAIQNERSQLQNRETALTILRSKLAQLQLDQHKEKISDIKGPNQSAEWGNQIRSYVLHPYKQVKDLRTKYESSDPDDVLDGNLDGLINAYLKSGLEITEN